MDTILTFIGGFLEKAAGSGSLGWALFLFTLIVTVFMLIPIVSEIRSLQLADKIRPLHEGILNKFQNMSKSTKNLPTSHCQNSINRDI